MDIATTRKNRPKGRFFENYNYKKICQPERKITVKKDKSNKS